MFNLDFSDFLKCSSFLIWTSLIFEMLLFFNLDLSDFFINEENPL